METIEQTNKNQLIEIGFNIQIKPIKKKGFISELKDYEIINLLE